MENFDSMLALVKEYIIDLWEVRKVKLYGEPCSTQPQSQSSAGDLRDGTRHVYMTRLIRILIWLGGREEVSLVSSVTQGE